MVSFLNARLGFVIDNETDKIHSLAVRVLLLREFTGIGYGSWILCRYSFGATDAAIHSQICLCAEAALAECILGHSDCGGLIMH